MFQFNLAHLPPDLRAKAERYPLDVAKALKRGLALREKTFGYSDEVVRFNEMTCAAICKLASNAMRTRAPNRSADGRGQYVGGGKHDSTEAVKLMEYARRLTSDDRACWFSDEPTRLALQTLILNNVACAYRAVGRMENALASLQRALQIETTLAGSSKINPVRTRLNLCSLLSKMGLHEEALNHAQAAITMIRENPKLSKSKDEKGAVTSVAAIAYHNLAVEEEFLGRRDAALRAYKASCRAARRHLAPNDPMIKSIERNAKAAMRSVKRRAPDFETGLTPLVGAKRETKGGRVRARDGAETALQRTPTINQNQRDTYFNGIQHAALDMQKAMEQIDLEDDAMGIDLGYSRTVPQGRENPWHAAADAGGDDASIEMPPQHRARQPALELGGKENVPNRNSVRQAPPPPQKRRAMAVPDENTPTDIEVWQAQHDAATNIQAQIRRSQVARRVRDATKDFERRLLQDMAAGEIQRVLRGSQVRRHVEESQRHQAACKIQAHARRRPAKALQRQARAKLARVKTDRMRATLQKEISENSRPPTTVYLEKSQEVVEMAHSVTAAVKRAELLVQEIETQVMGMKAPTMPETGMLWRVLDQKLRNTVRLRDLVQTQAKELPDGSWPV
eukprot:g4587.t1